MSVNADFVGMSDSIICSALNDDDGDDGVDMIIVALTDIRVEDCSAWSWLLQVIQL